MTMVIERMAEALNHHDLDEAMGTITRGGQREVEERSEEVSSS